MRQTPNRNQPFLFPLAGKEEGYIYFLGIGGIGMSALARYLQAAGYAVSGYDKTESDLTRSLQRSGIDVHYTDDIGCIPQDLQLIVYTPAVPTELGIYQYCLASGRPMKKRSEVLQALTAGTYNVCVAGTHGKTTTSTMIAHVLRHCGYGCQAYLGGISVNYDTNTWSSDRNVSVIEADEYDRSFLRLLPDLALITAMDPDHLDIYGTVESMEEAYIDFTKLLSDQGVLLYHHSLKRATDLQAPHRFSYALGDRSADYRTTSIVGEGGGYRFDLHTPDGSITDCTMPVGGLHNVENAVGAAAIAHQLGIDAGSIRSALSCFRGVKRRFEVLYKAGETCWIDDYAHHPEELRALLEGVRHQYPTAHITIVFQPHLFTRTRDLASDFGEVLSIADEAMLLPIYPARELPISGVSSEMIRSAKHPDGFPVVTKETFMNWVIDQWHSGSDRPAVLVTAGAGDIDQTYPFILKRLGGQ
ncbi:MAG: UDP-N-acetylmuramate--L-alanine ligase [Bacteroidota bacterium]